MLAVPANRPTPGCTIVAHNGFRSRVLAAGLEALGLILVHEAGLFTRVIPRLLALNTAIWHDWRVGTTHKRSLIAYDH